MQKSDNQLKREREVVNRALMSAGLGKLDDPGLVRQIGFLVQKVVTDHKQVMLLLARCAPEARSDMYEALRPYLQRLPGGPKALDVYMAENALEAEIKRIPTDAGNGHLRPARVQEISSKKTDLQVANEVIKTAFAKGRLMLVCAECTFEQDYFGLRREDAVDRSVAAGWLQSPDGTRSLCPKCAALRQ